MPEIDPYFTDQARAAFARAGIDPDLSGPLAEWAQAAHKAAEKCDVHQGEMEFCSSTCRGPRWYVAIHLGVLVAENGEIIAETRYYPVDGAAYVGSVLVDLAPADRRVVETWEVGMAKARLARATGKRVIHVTYSEVCEGAGRYVGRQS